jgi:hypothetical protein
VSTAACLNGSWAGDASVHEDGAVTWQAGVDGVEIEWNTDGSVRRISSRYSAPVEFPDRRGIQTAYVIAEEKAKAAIIRFLDQSVSSNRMVTEVQNDVNKATQERQTSVQASVKKVDERTLIQKLSEVTSSFAKGNLRGVVALEKGYDSKAEEAWVVVGISGKSINAAAAIRQFQSGQTATPTPLPTNMDWIQRQPSEIKRSTQDW